MCCHPRDKVEMSYVPVITPTPLNRNTAAPLHSRNKYGGSTTPGELLHKEFYYYNRPTVCRTDFRTVQIIHGMDFLYDVCVGIIEFICSILADKKIGRLLSGV